MVHVTDGPGDLAERPEGRIIRYSRDAEIAAAEWLRFWGAADARTHGPGADGGVDVESSQLVVQVKARVSPAGRPELQRLHGVAVAKGKQGTFFSLGGFTAQAAGWANQVELALFEFDLQGEPRPVNAPAYRIAGQEPPTFHPPIAHVQDADDKTMSGTVVQDDTDRDTESASRGSLPSPAPTGWQPRDTSGTFVKYARRLQRNGHRVTGYAVSFASDPEDRLLVQNWAEAGVFGNYVVVDHETGRVEGYRTWAEAYAATCEWDGGTLAPSVKKSLPPR